MPAQPQGVLVRADSVSRDGEHQECGEFVVTLEEDTLDIRLGDRKDTIWMVSLTEVEETLHTLQRWVRQRADH